MILRVVGAEQHRREALEKAYLFGNRSRALPAPAHLQYASLTEGRTLDMRDLPNKFTNGGSLNVIQIWIFLKNLIVVPSGPDAVGVSWLELFAKFAKEGGCLDRNLHVSMARKMPSTKQALALFTKTVRFVVSLCMSPAEAMLFTACRNSSLRLLPAGINSFMPCVNFLPCWGGENPPQTSCFAFFLSALVSHST